METYERCTMGTKEIERIETEVNQLKNEISSMVSLFQSIIDKKLYDKDTPQNPVDKQLAEPVPNNKIDRIIGELKRCIEIIIVFKKENLSGILESELEKL